MSCSPGTRREDRRRNTTFGGSPKDLDLLSSRILKERRRQPTCLTRVDRTIGVHPSVHGGGTRWRALTAPRKCPRSPDRRAGLLTVGNPSEHATGIPSKHPGPSAPAHSATGVVESEHTACWANLESGNITHVLGPSHDGNDCHVAVFGVVEKMSPGVGTSPLPPPPPIEHHWGVAPFKQRCAPALPPPGHSASPEHAANTHVRTAKHAQSTNRSAFAPREDPTASLDPAPETAPRRSATSAQEAQAGDRNVHSARRRTDSAPAIPAAAALARGLEEAASVGRWDIVVQLCSSRGNRRHGGYAAMSAGAPCAQVLLVREGPPSVIRRATGFAARRPRSTGPHRPVARLHGRRKPAGRDTMHAR
jgi:hypothetical protein